MDKKTFDSVDWKFADDSCDDSWRNYTSFAFSKDSQEFKSFKEWYSQDYSSEVYYPKYVQLIAKAKCLKLF